jgi:hypothetical protein
VFAVNNSPTEAASTQIQLNGFSAAPMGQQWLIEPAGSIVSGGINDQDRDNLQINGLVHPDPQMMKTLIPRPVAISNPLQVMLPASGMMLLKIPQAGSDVTPPAAPSQLTAATRSLSVVLNWQANTEPDFKGYVVYRAQMPSGEYTRLNIDLLTSPGYTDSDVAADTSYSYVVTAVDMLLNESASSSEQVIKFPKTEVGSILREYWTGISGSSVSNLTSHADYPNNPNGRERLTKLEGPTNWKDNYGSRFRGYLHPLVTGSYRFWIASDDKAELWLSTSGNPAGRVLIASVPNYTGQYQWEKYSSQKSALKSLTAGQKYYIEVLHKESAGGDHLAVAWSGPEMTQQVIDGIYLSPWHEGLKGDFNRDQDVNLEDFYELAVLWMNTNCFATAGVDCNGDCQVNGFEFLQMMDNWAYNALPAAVTNLSATGEDHRIVLDWGDNTETDLDGYTVYRSAVSGNGYAAIAAGLTESYFTDTTAAVGITYYYVVKAVDVFGNESGPGSEVSAYAVVNLSLGKTTAADSTLSSSTLSSYAVDGNKVSNTSRWLSANSAWPHWIEVDLGADCTISRLNFWTGYNGYNQAVKNFQFQYWDGASWVDIINETDNTNPVYSRTFDAVIARKVRLYGTAGTDNYFRLYEIEVWGRPN